MLCRHQQHKGDARRKETQDSRWLLWSWQLKTPAAGLPSVTWTYKPCYALPEVVG